MLESLTRLETIMMKFIAGIILGYIISLGHVVFTAPERSAQENVSTISCEEQVKMYQRMLLAGARGWDALLTDNEHKFITFLQSVQDELKIGEQWSPDMMSEEERVLLGAKGKIAVEVLRSWLSHLDDGRKRYDTFIKHVRDELNAAGLAPEQIESLEFEPQDKGKQ